MKKIIGISALVLAIFANAYLFNEHQSNNDSSLSLKNLINNAYAQVDPWDDWWLDDPEPDGYIEERYWKPCTYWVGDVFGGVEFTVNEEAIRCEWTVVPESCVPMNPC